MDPSRHYRGILVAVILLKIVSAQLCYMPTNLQNSVWEDSDKGTLVFSTVDMTGLDFTITGGGSTVDTWNCFLNADFTTHRIVILESTVTVNIFSVVYRPYVCMELYTVSAYSYYYYILGVEEVRFDYERLSVREDSVTITASNALSELCINGTNGPTVNEYHFLLKGSSESLAAQACPQDFQDEFWYSVSDGTTTTCNTQSEHWDVCADTSRMAYNYTQCNTHVAFSSTGNVICMMSITDGSDVITTVYNTDTTVDNSNTYKFTCFRSTKYANESMSVSQSPMSCTRDQTSTTIPIHNRTNDIYGMILSLHPHPTSACDPTTTTSTTSTTSTTTSTTSTTTSTTSTTTSTTSTTTSTTSTTTSTSTTSTTTTPTTTTTTPTTTSTTTTTPTTTSTSSTTSTTTPTTTSTSTTSSTTSTTTTPTTTTTTTTPIPTTTTAFPTTTTKAATASSTSDSGTDNTMTIIAIALGKGTTHNTNGIIIQRDTGQQLEPSTFMCRDRKRTIEAPAEPAMHYQGQKRREPIQFQGGVAACLTIALIIVFIFYKCCKRKRPITPEPLKEPTPTPSPEPDPDIEAMSHTTSGLAGLTPRSLMGPRETSILEPGIKRPNTSLFVFPEAKSNDFKITMPTVKDSYGIPPAPWKKVDSNRPGIARSASMLSHRPSPIPEEGVKGIDDRKTQSLRTKHPTLQSENTAISLNGHVPRVFNVEQRRSSIPKNSVSPVSSPIMEDTNAKTQFNTSVNYTEPPGSPNDKVVTDTSETSELNKSHVEVPETARPIVITPETEQRVNLKSRLAFVEHDKPPEKYISEKDISEQGNDNTDQSYNFENDNQNTNINATNSTTVLFKTLELNEASVSKEADDVVLMHTPHSYLSSRRGSKGSATSDMLEMPTSNGKVEGFDANFSRLSPITSTPFENTTPRTYDDNSLGAKIQSVELM